MFFFFVAFVLGPDTHNNKTKCVFFLLLFSFSFFFSNSFLTSERERILLCVFCSSFSKKKSRFL